MRLSIVILFLSVGICVAEAQTVYRNLSYGTNSYQKLDGYVASQAGSRIVVIVHGGGWISGDKSDIANIAQLFWNAGFAVANINYRLAPAATFPAQSSDLACAIAYVKQHAQTLNGDSSRVALWGHSAGGHLVTFHGVNAPLSRLQGCSSSAGLKVDKVVGVAGVYDFDLCTPFCLQYYVRPMVGDSARYWKAAQPVEYAAAPAAAKFLLVAGVQDTDVVWQDGRAFYDSLAGHGTTAAFVLFPGYDHFSILNTSSTDPLSTIVIPFLKDQPLPVPSPPTLALPSNGAVDQSITPTLTWNASSGTASYRLQVSRFSTFSSVVYDQPGISSTSQQVTGLVNSTTYYWRVNATDAGGTSGWSNPIFSFTTMAPPPPPAPPVLATPANGSTGVATNATLTWNASSGSYILPSAGVDRCGVRNDGCGPKQHHSDLLHGGWFST